MRVYLQLGVVRIDCPECNHRPEITKPIGEVVCPKCKHKISFDLKMKPGHFRYLRRKALQVEFQEVVS